MDSTLHSADVKGQTDLLSHDDDGVAQETAKLIVQVALGTTSNLFLGNSA